MVATFSKSAFKNLGYIYADHAASISSGQYISYAWGTLSGQRFAIYYPDGSPSDYPEVNGVGATTWAYVVHIVQSSFDTSADDNASSAAASITSAQGVLWQILNRGIAIVFVQVTSANTANTGGGVPLGKGYVHARGGIMHYYESRFRPAPYKDVIMAIQWLQLKAATYSLNANRWGLSGDSSGAHWAGWCGLAPNRAGEIGLSAQGMLNTVPNVFYVSRVLVMSWPYYQSGNSRTATVYSAGTAAYAVGDHVTHIGITWVCIQINGTGSSVQTPGSAASYWVMLSVTPTMFPLAELGGAGVDDTVALELQSAPRRYLEEFSGVNWISRLGTKCIPPTFWASNTPADTLAIHEPFIENISNFTPASGGVHTVWHGLVLRNNMPSGLVKLSVATTSASLGEASDGLALPAHWYDVNYGSGSVNDGATAGVYTKDAKGAEAVDFICANIAERRWDFTMPEEGITRRGQVNHIGRTCVPMYRSTRDGVLLSCSGGNDLIYGYARGETMGRVEPGGAPVVVPGNGWLWLRAAGGGSAVSSYIATEMPK